MARHKMSCKFLLQACTTKLGIHAYDCLILGCYIYLTCFMPSYVYFMSYLIHVTPIYLSLCLRCFNPLFTITTFTIIIVVFTLLLLLLFHCCQQITVTTDKLLREKSFSGVVELTTQLLRLINIIWLPLCRIGRASCRERVYVLV